MLISILVHVEKVRVQKILSSALFVHLNEHSLQQLMPTASL